MGNFTYNESEGVFEKCLQCVRCYEIYDYKTNTTHLSNTESEKCYIFFRSNYNVVTEEWNEEGECPYFEKLEFAKDYERGYIYGGNGIMFSYPNYYSKHYEIKLMKKISELLSHIQYWEHLNFIFNEEDREKHGYTETMAEQLKMLCLYFDSKSDEKVLKFENGEHKLYINGKIIKNIK